MSKRRPSGDGLIRKRSDGRWEGRIVVGHRADGYPIYRSVFAKTQRELMPKLNQLKEYYAGMSLTEHSKITLGEWLDRWLTEIKEPMLRGSTMEGYRGQRFLADVRLDMIVRISSVSFHRASSEHRLFDLREPSVKPLAERDLAVLGERHACIVFLELIELWHQLSLCFCEHRAVDRISVGSVTDHNSSFPTSVASLSYQSVARRSAFCHIFYPF